MDQELQKWGKVLCYLVRAFELAKDMLHRVYPEVSASHPHAPIHAP
jgi:hypothetical protein